MESRLSVAGQAVQPILVMFPLGLFAMAVMFDMADLLGGPSILGALAYWNVVAGLVGGALAAVAGAVDVMFVRRSQDRRLGALRSLINMGVLVVFAVIAMLRVQADDRVVGGGLFTVELLALGLAAFGAWFGGELANGRPPAFAKAAVGARAAAGGRNY
ncbi:hypothetical protein Ait01nite_085250 [Actinoplanes italicus]|uniref:Putative membrane protein n=1 Tax=Actinoplanes italicus TaxID=113567 RepID=A0A2T0JWU1_9ACTN|nr:DUF2231 domain-containing protein [Actinoplanes italicus]PRX12361.1 putative membrane protein [Actinoplanes italicus]GIE35480.1 hypothetical protein Ait01nite_085250 [Actinoplanes italicus]